MEFGNNGFEETGRMEYPKKNLSEQRREPAKNSAMHLHQCQDLNVGQIGALEASALTTAPKTDKCYIITE